MSGALGCCIALLVVGSLIAAFGNDWPAHAMAGHTAIGGCICKSFVLNYDLFLLAFVYFYCINFAYSWAPIGWGMKIHLIITPCIVLIIFMQCFLARSSLSTSGPLVSQLRRRVPGCQICISFLSQLDTITDAAHSIIGLVSPRMLAHIGHGGTYFFFAAFSILAFFSACK